MSQEMTQEEIDTVLNQHRKLLSEKTLNFHEVVKSLLILNDMTLKDKALTCSSIHHNLLTTYYAEVAYLNRLEKAKEKALDIYTQKFGKPGVPKFKTAEEAKQTEDVQKIEAAIEEQQQVVRYLKECLEIMKGYSYNIRNAVELTKLESGGA